MLDGCPPICLPRHISAVAGMLCNPIAACTQEEVVRGVHCTAELTLQATQRLMEVRAAARGALNAAEPARFCRCCA